VARSPRPVWPAAHGHSSQLPRACQPMTQQTAVSPLVLLLHAVKLLAGHSVPYINRTQAVFRTQRRGLSRKSISDTWQNVGLSATSFIRQHRDYDHPTATSRSKNWCDWDKSRKYITSTTWLDMQNKRACIYEAKYSTATCASQILSRSSSVSDFSLIMKRIIFSNFSTYWGWCRLSRSTMDRTLFAEIHS